MAVISEAIRVSQDRRVSYVIWDRHITGPSHGWRWDPYDGTDPHTNHMHVSVNDVHHDETQDWVITLLTETDLKNIENRVWNHDIGPDAGTQLAYLTLWNHVQETKKSLQTIQDALVAMAKAFAEFSDKWQGPTATPPGGTTVTGTFTGTVQ